jgi:hypothetical protein
MDRQTDLVCRVNWVSRVGNTEQKIGGSSRAANTEVWVMENLANTESWITENSANTESRAIKNSANMESWVTKIRLTQKTRLYMTRGGGGQETGRKKRCCSKQKASSRVVPKGYYQDTKT